MSETTVLLLCADEDMRRLVADCLAQQNLRANTFDDPEEAVAYVVQRRKPRIALIATALPKMSGYHAADRLRAVADLSIIFLAVANDDKLRTDEILRHGDDFITDPITVAELGLRIRMVLDRTPALDYTGLPLLRVDSNLSIDFARNRVLVGGNLIGLTPKERDLLHVLVRNAPRVVTTEALLARVWTSARASDDTLRVHIHRLRRKLESDSHHPKYLRTERGVGYRFALRPPGLSVEAIGQRPLSDA